jgi:hypothetical protein
MNSETNRVTIKLYQLPFLAIFIYLFITFLPLPGPVKTGLDPSWSYGIAHAVQKQLIFGKDIIFTYGPLGYLISSPAFNQNFFQIIIFRWSVYLFLFIVSILRIITTKNYIRQIFLFSSIVFPLLIGSPYIGVGFSSDYQILFIVLTILSFNDIIQKRTRLIFFLLGCISGFCFLTKFTLGIYTFGVCTLYLLVSCCQSIIRKSDAEFNSYFFALINFVLSSFSISFIFLSPHLSFSYLLKVIFYLILAGSIGASIWLIQKQFKSRFKYKSQKLNKLLSIFKNNFLLPQLIFYAIYLCLLAQSILLSHSPSLIDYLTNSWEISSGYSSAMSIVGNKTELVLAISAIFLIACIMLFVAEEGYVNLSLSFLFALFLSFKHGFVRQDGHVVIFAIVAPLVASLLILKISKWRYQKISYYFLIYLLFASALISLPAVDKLDRIVKLMPQPFVNAIIGLVRESPKQETLDRISYLSEINNTKFNIEKLQSITFKKSLNNLDEVQLPDNIKDLVNRKKVDIIPWEISLVAANQLNWKPRPIFQSYSAYTKSLDNLNFESYVKEPRDYIFYDFTSIDGRHPFFDEPKTFSHVLCNYQLSADASNFINTKKQVSLILLEKRNSSRCSSIFLSDKLSINWNTVYPIEISEGTITRASIKFKYSLIGKIYKTIFRAPPVMMKIDYLDGDQKTYRIIPENSENGVIVSHLPRNANEALSFWQGQLPARVSSFYFQTSNPLLYTTTIEIIFRDTNYLNNSQIK